LKPAKRRRPKRCADLAHRISKRIVEAIMNHKLPRGMPLREAKTDKEIHVTMTPVL